MAVSYISHSQLTTMCFGGFRSRCCRRQWPHEKLLHSYKRDCNVCVPPAVTEGVTPLFMAVKSGSVQVCELLRLQRVDLKAQADGTPNDTCLVLTQSPLMINIIYSKIGVIFQRNCRWGTHWWLPAQMGTRRCMWQRVPVARTCACGCWTTVPPLMHETANVSFKVLALLSATSVRMMANSFLCAAVAGGSTALHVAARAGHILVMQTLLVHGAAIDAMTGDGLSPLHGAASAGQLTAVALLIDRGANVNAKYRFVNKKGQQRALSHNSQLVDHNSQPLITLCSLFFVLTNVCNHECLPC